MILNNTKNLTFNCDDCGKVSVKKWNPIKKKYSEINEISYWTDKKGYKNFNLLCRNCLKVWYEKDSEEFFKLVPYKKQKMFSNYKRRGDLNEENAKKTDIDFSKYK